jgi:hypothetical protein
VQDADGMERVSCCWVVWKMAAEEGEALELQGRVEGAGEFVVILSRGELRDDELRREVARQRGGGGG